MGAYCPAPIASREIVKKIAEEIMTPLVLKMKSDGNEYKGFLYAGMIMTQQGPKVIEFNVRFGDPECQPTMMMIKTDLYRPLSLALEGKLDEANIEFNSGAACCVVLASQRYPENYKKGFQITGLNKAGKIKNIKIFHAGTKLDGDNIVTAGGRVLGVTGYSPSGIIHAQQLVYEAVSKINIHGGFYYRKDIADKAIKF
jgi:phosphoribosylamine--glycine ligase